MSEGFKNWGSVIAILGVIGFIVGLIGSFPILLYCSICGFIFSIILFICGGFCKILEDSRDSLKRIEELLEKENNKE